MRASVVDTLAMGFIGMFVGWHPFKARIAAHEYLKREAAREKIEKLKESLSKLSNTSGERQTRRTPQY